LDKGSVVSVVEIREMDFTPSPHTEPTRYRPPVNGSRIDFGYHKWSRGVRATMFSRTVWLTRMVPERQKVQELVSTQSRCEAKESGGTPGGTRPPTYP